MTYRASTGSRERIRSDESETSLLVSESQLSDVSRHVSERWRPDVGREEPPHQGQASGPLQDCGLAKSLFIPYPSIDRFNKRQKPTVGSVLEMLW